MRGKPVYFDRATFEGAVNGRKLYRVGLWFLPVAIVAGVLARVLVGGNPPFPDPDGSIARVSYCVAAAAGFTSLLCTGVAAWMASNAVGYSRAIVVLGSLFSLIVPCLYLLNLYSLSERLRTYFMEWEVAFGARLGLTPEQYLAGLADGSLIYTPPLAADIEAVPSSPVTLPPASATPDRIERLERLTALWKSGALSDEEFAAEKQRLA